MGMIMGPDQIGVAVDVAPFVAAFLHLDAAHVPLRNMAQIRFRLGPQAARYRMADGSTHPAPDAYLLGPHADALRLEAEHPVTIFGIALTAKGWSAMIGGDPSLMAGRVVDGATLFGAGLHAPLAALRAAPDLEARTAIGEAVVRALVRTGDSGTRRFVRQVDTWLSASPSPEMEALEVLTGVSRRQIERRCKALYGMPPKLLARRYRALRAAAAIRAGEESLGTVIARGFYDQSHLIREIKQFTGLTPGQIRADPTILAHLPIPGAHSLPGR